MTPKLATIKSCWDMGGDSIFLLVPPPVSSFTLIPRLAPMSDATLWRQEYDFYHITPLGIVFFSIQLIFCDIQAQSSTCSMIVLEFIFSKICHTALHPCTTCLMCTYSTVPFHNLQTWKSVLQIQYTELIPNTAKILAIMLITHSLKWSSGKNPKKTFLHYVDYNYVIWWCKLQCVMLFYCMLLTKAQPLCAEHLIHRNGLT